MSMQYTSTIVEIKRDHLSPHIVCFNNDRLVKRAWIVCVAQTFPQQIIPHFNYTTFRPRFASSYPRIIRSLSSFFA